MTPLKYIIQSLTYYKSKHLAILLGTILSTAVLTGALIVGDSVTYSLQQLVSKRLGNVKYALETGERFVSDSLSVNFQKELGAQVSGVLKLNGLAINNNAAKRLNNITILGVDSTFANLADANFPKFTDDELLISENTAQRLKVAEGDELLLRTEQVDVIPVNAPFAQEKNPSVAFRLKVKKVLGDNEWGRFSLKSDQKSPYNIWVKQSVLWKRLELENKVNTILIADKENEIDASIVEKALNKIWTLEDASLKLAKSEQTNYFKLTSDRVFIDQVFSKTLVDRYKAEATLSYLVNSISSGSKTTPYSFAAGVSSNLLSKELKNDEIILNSWCATDLNISVGDSVLLEYYVIGAFRKLENKSKAFLVKAIQQNQTGLFTRELTPEFPGLNDAESCSEWDTGVPIDLDKIRDKDEEFWDNYNATPKAIISLERAQQLWGNQFGETTALQFVKTGVAQENLEYEIASLLEPQSIGLQFRNVYAEGNKAIENSVDFGELFLSLSFFVIAAGILLLVLLYILHIVSRKTEIGVLSALGFSKSKISKLFLAESLITIIIGGLIGVYLGVFYNSALIAGLNTIWLDAVRTDTLEILIKPETLVIGFFSGVVLAFGAIYWVIRKQVDGTITKSLKEFNLGNQHYKRTKWIAMSIFCLDIIIIIYLLLTGQSQNASLFLSAGGILLISMLSFLSFFLKKQLFSAESKNMSFTSFAIKNLSRNSMRSLMAIALLALGTFSVIITGANRKTFYNDFDKRQSGTGGFLLWVENSLPINHNLNDKEGQQMHNIADEAIVDSMAFIQMLALSGDDASCLNLNQVQNPQILGVEPDAFDLRGAFSFSELLDGIDRKSPWLELNNSYSTNTIPAYIDQTVITWGLMKKVGDTLFYKDEFGEDLNIIIAGGLNSSIFQGNVLISDIHFKKHFPNVGGSNFTLIDGDKKHLDQISELLSFYFQDYGIDYQLTSDRLAMFNSVTNTYLNVFMLLGGLGVLIGTIGFGIILLRNKLERKKEIALLSAIGIKPRHLVKILFTEHLILLLSGLLVGLMAASIGLLPSILTESFEMPLAFVISLLIAIFINGVLWIGITAITINKQSLIKSLRVE